MTPLYQLFAVSAVVMGMAHTIARERMFAPLRARLGGHETWLGYLVSCPYCLSHWLAFVVVPITRTYAVTVAYQWGAFGRVLTWFLSSILVTVIAAFLRVAFFFVDESQGLVRKRRQLVVERHEREAGARPQAEPDGQRA